MGNSSTEHRERVKDILKGDIYSQVKDVVGYGTRDAGRSERCDGGLTRGKGLYFHAIFKSGKITSHVFSSESYLKRFQTKYYNYVFGSTSISGIISSKNTFSCCVTKDLTTKNAVGIVRHIFLHK